MKWIRKRNTPHSEHSAFRYRAHSAFNSVASRGRFRAGVALWVIATLFMLCWIVAIVYAPYALASEQTNLAHYIYRFYSFLCHQIPSRSFHIGAHPFAVCARCFGLYAGLAAGLLMYPIFRSMRNPESPSRVWLLLAPIPTTIDFALTYFGIWENTHLSRVVTGAILGIGCAFFIVPGLIDLAQTEWRKVFNRSAKEKNVQPNLTAEASSRTVASDYSSPARRI
jgi:uncharacterized membrane protein